MINKKKSVIFYFFLTIFFLTTPLYAFAHEVYVLSPTEAQTALHTPSLSALSIIQSHELEFSLYAFIGAFLVFCLFFISITRRFEAWFDPFLNKLKHFAPIISRMTVGLAFIAGAYYRASYGPELPLTSTFGHYTLVIVALLYGIGILIILGLWVRIASFIALCLFALAVYLHEWYMLTYLNYAGEIILLLLAGAGGFALQNSFQKSKLGKSTYQKIEQIGFLLLRIFFGISLIFASVYAKLIHENLGLLTVEKYHLTNYLHFEPHFLVLGAALVEITIGLFFILGVEIRFTSIFLLFWLTLSLLFFGEVVWPHIILIGIPIAFFCYGYDEYSLEGYFFKRHGREPVF